MTASPGAPSTVGRGARLATTLLRTLGALVVVAFVAVAFTRLPAWLFARTAAAPDVAPAEAIVVLGGAASPEGILYDSSLRRAVTGIRLQRAGLAPILIFSGRPQEARMRAQLAAALGVTPSSIVTVVGAQTTREEAEAVRARLGSAASRILLVTDSQHMVRARRLFERVGFAVSTAPADPLSGESTDPDERMRVVLWILGEAAARLYYHLAGYL